METMESNEGLNNPFVLRKVYYDKRFGWLTCLAIFQLSQSQFERLTAERLDAESKRLRDDVGTRVTSSRREVGVN